MNTRRTTALAAFTSAAVIGGLVTSVSASAAPPATAPAVSYSATPTGDSVTTTLDGGTFTLSPDGASVLIRDVAGQLLDSLPTALRLDGHQIAIDQRISPDGRSLVSTPDWDAVRHEDIRPVAAPLENQLAMNDLINSVSIGSSIGSLIGTAIGAVVGVGVGFAIAGASCLVLTLGCALVVLPVVTLVGGVGGLVGLALGGGPTAAAALFDYFSVLRAAPGESKYAPYLPNHGRPAASATEETR
ncbi:hypothetical protein ACIRRA_24890 [Nocardia sp. NPDC101769]|uniref:hypothetical protein n=1 Tax=Nocardia sp. NPDC101769 TaxID=3364333 RepID=UPI0038306BD8